ncbi:uncharacterized protein LOC120425108 [Culex pipiens pallens]|uniref:uncharacterized protein LOC120425108 n=1 Tax=Culex pipiens pallens TaxID=42434 RepID=UPI001953CF55|nr:uncharacterized protein LOC120425108 [Culex pipiens pallens]
MKQSSSVASTTRPSRWPSAPSSPPRCATSAPTQPARFRYALAEMEHFFANVTIYTLESGTKDEDVPSSGSSRAKPSAFKRFLDLTCTICLRGGVHHKVHFENLKSSTIIISSDRSRSTS